MYSVGFDDIFKLPRICHTDILPCIFLKHGVPYGYTMLTHSGRLLHMHQLLMSVLFPIMAFHLFGGKPLFKPMLNFNCNWNSLTTVISLTWEYPYLGKTVFMVRRGPGVGHHCTCNTLAPNFIENSLVIMIYKWFLMTRWWGGGSWVLH